MTQGFNYLSLGFCSVPLSLIGFAWHEPCGSRPGCGTAAPSSVCGGEGQWKAMCPVGEAREGSGVRVNER
ncbi:hypothetical protein AAFF_G00418760 [Aldrovandia affinis]|uniref:Secreted protein n=1 Tax=Aldrovandia affinis TaxID=143900 RepID=A0AAD7R3U7_9TELE|nr:hypothetical protein AAFF_G00418760 [Aldrovandia affinis]